MAAAAAVQDRLDKNVAAWCGRMLGASYENALTWDRAFASDIATDFRVLAWIWHSEIYLRILRTL